ncbi:UNVERIFIED_CONTAM: Calcium/calmodulin-regulated receptor-like kinase [Sesamum radiatum]|uniref:Calcium/calmodulin-regulated receptor-like kinase n=1 Tax=Sesamum radiatum TaxID=300843 RepID=A0AAW2LNJ4_SESRA
MRGESTGLIIGLSVGVVIGVALAIAAFFCFRYHRKHSQIGNSSSRRTAAMPIRANGADSCTILSDSSVGTESPRSTIQIGLPLWLGGLKKASLVSASGILEYSYKDLQKATCNFTTLIGQGAYGPVYKAQMSSGETVAVKVLATDSKQGEKEFQTEVMLLGRLHHRNLVNLVGYCAEKNQHMLIYVYMSRGSLASHLYITYIILFLEDIDIQLFLYPPLILCLAVPSVIHRDIKSSNILLDHSMRARVADFGLSREELVSKQVSNVRGTFGYLDPEYVSTRSFTKKSDVYSYGVLLFELIAGRNPLQGLMEYVELAAMNTEGKVGWEEIVDPRLDGKYDIEELDEVATLAHKCVNRVARRRPSMRDIVQVLSRILKSRHIRNHQSSSSTPRAGELEKHIILQPNKEEDMAAMAALQSSFTSLNLSSNSFLGQRFFSPSLYLPAVKSTDPPNSVVARFSPIGIPRHITCISTGLYAPTCCVVAHPKATQKLKRWERKECKPNSLPVLHKMHVRVGDTVKVIAGNDKGKIGEVVRVIKHNSRIVVKDINLKTKHVKSKEEGEQGQIIRIEAPLHSSNVMLYSKEEDVVSRVGHKTLENGKRVRYLIKTGEIIDSAENWKKVVKEKEKSTEVAAAS